MLCLLYFLAYILHFSPQTQMVKIGVCIILEKNRSLLAWKFGGEGAMSVLITLALGAMAFNTATGPQVPNFWTHGEAPQPDVMASCAKSGWHTGSDPPHGLEPVHDPGPSAWPQIQYVVLDCILHFSVLQF